ncbi:MAG: hypothetical protein AB7S81_06925 [Bdellovibrionales bacterium]
MAEQQGTLSANNRTSGAGDVTQDDIDALLDIGALLNGPSTEEPTNQTPEEEDNYDDELSQEDIHSLLNGSTDDEADANPSPEDTDDDELSQDDIDSLLNGSPDEADANPSPVNTDGNELSQADVEELLAASEDTNTDQGGGEESATQGFPNMAPNDTDETKAFLAEHSDIFRSLPTDQQDQAIENLRLYQSPSGNAMLLRVDTKAVQLFPATPDEDATLRNAATANLRAMGVPDAKMDIIEGNAFGLNAMFVPYMSRNTDTRSTASSAAAPAPATPAPEVAEEAPPAQSPINIQQADSEQSAAFLARHSNVFEGLAENLKGQVAQDIEVYVFGQDNSAGYLYDKRTNAVRIFAPHAEKTVLEQIEGAARDNLLNRGVAEEDLKIAIINHTKLNDFFLDYEVQAIGARAAASAEKIKKAAEATTPETPPQEGDTQGVDTQETTAPTPPAEERKPAEAQEASTGDGHQPVQRLDKKGKALAIAKTSTQFWSSLSQEEQDLLFNSVNLFWTPSTKNKESFIINPKETAFMIVVADNDDDKRILFAEASRLQKEAGVLPEEISSNLRSYTNLQDGLTSYVNVLGHLAQQATLGEEAGMDSVQEPTQRRSVGTTLVNFAQSAFGLPREIVTNKKVRAVAIPAAILVGGAVVSVVGGVAAMGAWGLTTGLAIAAGGAAITSIPTLIIPAVRKIKSSQKEEAPQEKPQRRKLGLGKVVKSALNLPFEVLTSKKMLTVGLPFAVSMGVGISAHAAFGLAAGAVCAATPLGLALAGGAVAGAAVNLVMKYTFGRRQLKENQSKRFIARCGRVFKTGMFGAIKGAATAGAIFLTPVTLVGATMAAIGATTGVVSTFGLNKQAYREAGAWKVIKTGAISGIIGGTLGMLMGSTDAHAAAQNADSAAIAPHVDPSAHGSDWMSQFVDKSSAYIQEQAHIAHERGQELGRHLVMLKDQALSLFNSDAHAATSASTAQADAGWVSEYWNNFLDSGKEQLDIAGNRLHEVGDQVSGLWHQAKEAVFGHHDSTAPAAPVEHTVPAQTHTPAPEVQHQAPEVKAPEVQPQQHTQTQEAPASKAPEVQPQQPTHTAPDAPTVHTVHDTLGFKSDLISEDVAKKILEAQSHGNTDQVMHICKEESIKLFNDYGNTQHMAAGKELLDHAIKTAENANLDPTKSETLQQLFRDRAFIDLHNLDGDGLPPTTGPIVQDLKSSGNVGHYAEKAVRYMKDMKMNLQGWNGPS